MKKSTKKGFTLVELVIVIAVIAILAAVLIPTFSNAVERANISADLQALTAELESKYVDYVADNHDVPSTFAIKDDKFVHFGAAETGETAVTYTVVEGKKGYAFVVYLLDGVYVVESLNETMSRANDIATVTLAVGTNETATMTVAFVKDNAPVEVALTSGAYVKVDATVKVTVTAADGFTAGAITVSAPSTISTNTVTVKGDATITVENASNS